jgi:hypothetical protein
LHLLSFGAGVIFNQPQKLVSKNILARFAEMNINVKNGISDFPCDRRRFFVRPFQVSSEPPRLSACHFTLTLRIEKRLKKIAVLDDIFIGDVVIVWL